jgi:hypothetical protein
VAIEVALVPVEVAAVLEDEVAQAVRFRASHAVRTTRATGRMECFMKMISRG